MCSRHRIKNKNYKYENEERRNDKSISTALTLSPFASLRIQIVWIETFRFLNVLEYLLDIHDAFLVHRIARYVTQIDKLQVQCAQFGQNAAATAGPSIVLAILFTPATTIWKKRMKLDTFVCWLIVYLNVACIVSPNCIAKHCKIQRGVE